MDRRSLLVLLAILALSCAGLALLLGRGGAAGAALEAHAALEPARASTVPQAELQAEPGGSARGAPRIGTPHTPARAVLAEGEARVAGWLRAQDEQPWREASVALLDNSSDGPPLVLAQSRCEPDGGFVVSAQHAGRAQFVVLARGFVPRAAELDLQPGAEQLLEDFELERGLSIAGTLRSNARPLARFEVVAIDERELPVVRLEGGELSWDGSRFDWRFTTAESGADGRYSIGGLHAGDYSLRISTCRGPMSSLCAGERPSRNVRAPSTDADFEFESSALALHFASGGQPLAGVEVELSAGSWRSGKRSDARGVAAFQLVPRLDCRLVASKPGYEELRLPVSAPASGASAAENLEMRAKDPEPEVHFLVSAPRGDPPAQLRVRLFALPDDALPAAIDRQLNCTPASATTPTREFVLSGVPAGPYRVLAFPGQPWNNELEPASYIGTHCPSEFVLVVPAQGELRQNVTAERRPALRLEFRDGPERFVRASCTLRDGAGQELPFVLVDPALGSPLVGHALSLLGPTLLYSSSCGGSARLQVDGDGGTLYNGECTFQAGLVTPIVGAR